MKHHTQDGRKGQKYIARAMGKDNHNPRPRIPTLAEHNQAKVKEHHKLDNDLIALNKRIHRMETFNLVAWWIVAAIAGFFGVVLLCLTFGL